MILETCNLRRSGRKGFAQLPKYVVATPSSNVSAGSTPRRAALSSSGRPYPWARSLGPPHQPASSPPPQTRHRELLAIITRDLDHRRVLRSFTISHRVSFPSEMQSAQKKKTPGVFPVFCSTKLFAKTLHQKLASRLLPERYKHQIQP